MRKITELPKLAAVTGSEPVWTSDATTGTDSQMTTGQVAAYAASLVPAPNFDPTNAAIADVKAVVMSLGAPLQSGGTVLVGNPFIPTLGLAATAVRSGTAFRAYLPYTGLTAIGTTLILALCNPAGSVKTLYITRTGGSFGSDAQMFRARVALATAVTGTAGAAISQSGGVTQAGAAAPASVARVVPMPALATGTTPAYELGVSIKAGVAWENQVNGEAAIPPGQAMLWVIAPAATLLSALAGTAGQVTGFAEWVEV